MNRTRGFTLMEVLVALVVIALALGALVRSVGQVGREADHLRVVTFARWAGQNVLAEQRLANQWPSPGSRSGVMEMGPYQFNWRMVISQTEDDNMRRMDVVVMDPVSETQQTLVGFVGKS